MAVIFYREVWENGILISRVPYDPTPDEPLKLAAMEYFVSNPVGKMSVEQALAYIDANVTNLASAKAVLKLLVEFCINLRNRGWIPP